MVILECRFDSLVVAEDCSIVDPRKADEVALYHTYFMMPVRLRVGDVEMLELNLPDAPHPQHPIQRMPSPAWQELPVLHVATVGLDTLKEAKETGTAQYDVPEDGILHLTIQAEDVHVVSSNRPDMMGHAPYHEVLDAFERFAAHIRQQLVQSCPELMEHPSWGAWFRGDVA